ncbi:MAG: oligosaccharide flippase family protein [Saprospiraceae bacterium]|nr:oligosaccharide flippase family protein [Saprospiraceae bacterium]
MQRKFLTNLGLLLFLNILIKAFWILFIEVKVQNLVGAEDYGFYFIILNSSFLFNIILDFGITSFNNKNIAQNNHLLNKHFSSIVIVKLMLAVAYWIILFVFALLMNFDEREMKFLVFVGINQFLISFILYLRSNISGLHFFKTDSFLSILDRALMIIICAILIWGGITETYFKIEWFVYAQTLSYIITALIAFTVVIRKAKFQKLHWNWPFFIMIIKQAFPYAVLMFLMTFYNRIDTIMIKVIITGEQASIQSGYYASAFRLLDAVNMIAYLFAVLLLPIFARMLKLKESIEQIAKLAFTLLFAAAIIVAVGSYFFRMELMELLYPTHAKESAAIFPILMTGFIAISTTYVFGTLLTANGSLKQLNLIAGSGMIISLVLNAILIPKFMAVGSGYASLSSQMLTAIVQVLVVVFIFKFKFNIRYIISLLVYVLGVLIVGYYSNLIHDNWIVNFAFLIVVSLVWASVLKLINIKSLIQIIKTK